MHEEAELRVNFQRTLRIPDDDRKYPLPAGLGRFPLRHVDDFKETVPERWIESGGVMLPMYQSEALWICFDSSYPFAVKIAAGRINAVTGTRWSNPLQRYPQDYVVTPEQPWLDGYCVTKGIIRQFVAMPLGAGYTAEEQITDEAEHGGLQIIAYPMKRQAYEKEEDTIEGVLFCASEVARTPDMGLAPGGRMDQDIYDEPNQFSDWDQDTMSRCFVRISNSLMWREITGEAPPTTPLSAKEYQKAGIPWFEYYNEDSTSVGGSSILKKLKSVGGVA